MSTVVVPLPAGKLWTQISIVALTDGGAKFIEAVSPAVLPPVVVNAHPVVFPWIGPDVPGVAPAPTRPVRTVDPNAAAKVAPAHWVTMSGWASVAAIWPPEV